MEPEIPNINRSLEQKEVEKYIKFFTLKSLHCVISSRTGCSSSTRCNPTAKGLDWFNIALPNGDANSKFDSAIREQFGKKVPGIYKPVSVDIILKTNDGALTLLESWQANTDVKNKEENIKNHFSIYNRLGVLLKSVISISRVLPSYQITQRYDSDFLLFFKVHSELYPLNHYELNSVIHIGSVITPIGEISLKTLYRNKIWLSPGSLQSLVSPYVIHDTSTLFPLTLDRDKKFKISENEIITSGLSPCLPDWFSLSSSGSSEVSTAFKKIDKLPPTIDNTTIEKQIPQPNLPSTDEEVERPIAAFVEPLDLTNMPNLDLPELPATPPFLSLMQETQEDDKISENNESTNTITSTNTFSEPSSSCNEIKSPILQRRAEAVGYEDDFVLVELRPAFCSDHDTVGSLFRQCQSPVPLEMFEALEKEDRESEPITLDTLLQNYQKELDDIENFFSSMSLSS